MSLTFHVPPDASPEVVRALFDVLASDGTSGISAAELKERVAGILSKQPRGEALALMRDLGLVAHPSREVRLSAIGGILSKSPESTDLIHGLSYCAWSAAEPERLSRMWTYRTVVDLLWEAAPANVSPMLKKHLVEDILARTEPVFAREAGFDAARASIGPKSVDGVLRWLEALSPPVLRGRSIQRRQRCAPSLMALAVIAAVTRAGADLGADFRLGNEERGFLCRACFLEPSALDAMLEWTVQTQPHYVRWGTPNARYGRQVVVLRDWPA